MPKRSNEFQRFVTRIYELMAMPGMEVRESAMFLEPGSDIEREIDILLEGKIANIPVRAAIECRGRKDKDDIEWIDGLIGKYKYLPIPVVVAVSKSGFSEAAERKARAAGITTLTLQEAMETDWPSELGVAGACGFQCKVRISRVGVVSKPRLPHAPDLAMIVVDEQQAPICTLREFSWKCWEQSDRKHVAEIEELKKLLELDAGKAECVKRAYECVERPYRAAWLVTADGSKYQLEFLVLLVELELEIVPATNTRHVLGDAFVTTAVVKQSTGDVLVTMVQQPDKPETVKVNLRRMN